MFGKVRGLKRLDDEEEDQLEENVDGLHSLKLCVARVSDLSNKIDDCSLIASVWSHVKMCGTCLLRKFSKILRALLCLKKEEGVSTWVSNKVMLMQM